MAISASDNSVSWIVDLLTGAGAQIMAVLAVASIGLLMLTGRLALRRAVVTIIGCFIVFGAAGIAEALNSLADNGQAADATGEQAYVYIPTQPPEPDLDPYSGAAAPDQSASTLLEGRVDGQ